MDEFEDIELNDGQSFAAMGIYLWFNELSNTKQTYVLSGYAGTRKNILD